MGGETVNFPITLDAKAIATAVALAALACAWRWLRAQNRLRARVSQLEHRQRLVLDVVRRLAFQVEDPRSAEELIRLRAKVDDVRDECWAEAGNERRRPAATEDE